jgi:uncharacterized small protein (DUF1192 family)
MLLWLALPVGALSRGHGLRAREAKGPLNPVTGVVELLKEMQANLEKEAKDDEDIYEKLACWCETNDKAKTKSISDAETLLSELGATIEKNTALSASLEVEIEGLGKEIATNEKSLETATALREKQKAEFIGEEKEMIQAIRALDAAIVVLSKHHDGGAALLSSVMKEVGAVAQKHGAILQGVITPSQRRLLASFVQGEKQPSGPPTFKEKYQPQSGEIFGILRQMKDTFETDLSQSQKDELDAQKAYDDMKAAKEAEIAAGKASLQDKKEQHATADERLAQAKSEKEDTEASLSADKKFLMDLKLKCSSTDSEWEERQKLRQEEISAVSKAIAILSSDDARDLFHHTLGEKSMVVTGLMQVASRSRSVRAERAAEVLEAAARRTQSPRLAALATAARIDPFTRVKKAIDDMVSALLEEKEEEVKQKDWCIDEFAKNERSTAKQVHTKGSLETKIESLDMSITNLNETIQTLHDEVADLEASKAKAKEDREAEAAEFKVVVADQQKTQALLQEATDVLKKVYAAEAAEGGALLQKRQQPPPGFDVYEKRGEAPGVITLLEHIIAGSKAMEAEAVKDEEAAQDEYMKFKQSTQDAIAAKESSIIDRKSELATMEEDRLQAKSELDGTVTELETLSNNLGGLHQSCDFLLKNFDVAQEARDQEVEALRQAKSFLSGMQQ